MRRRLVSRKCKENDLACGQSASCPPSRLRAPWLEIDPVAVVGDVLRSVSSSWAREAGVL
jgi:hypothetical protein